MTKSRMFLLISFIALLALVACGGGDGEQTDNDSAAPDAIEEESSGSPVGNQQGVRDRDRLSADFSDALTVEEQLAVGIMRLEESDLAVDETQAIELLPLWQAFQSLSNSETTAAAELTAVINQIQDTMDPEQVQAIADMELTGESMTALIESGDLQLRGFGGRGSGADGQEGATGGPGGFGGGPGGGLPGGGRPGGEGGPGGLPGGGFGELSEDDRATRQAQFAEGDFGDLQGQMLISSVVRLLQGKTGEGPERTGPFEIVLGVVAEETGISLEDIQAATTEGSTLAEVIENNGGDIEAVKTALAEAFTGSSFLDDQDMDAFIARFLGLEE